MGSCCGGMPPDCTIVTTFVICSFFFAAIVASVWYILPRNCISTASFG